MGVCAGHLLLLHGWVVQKIVMFWIYCPMEVGSCMHIPSYAQENWLLVLWIWKSRVLVLLAKTCRELRLLRNNTVLVFPFVILGGVLAHLNVPFVACRRRMKLLSLSPPAFSLCRLNSLWHWPQLWGAGSILGVWLDKMATALTKWLPL